MSCRINVIAAAAAALIASSGVALADVPGADWMSPDQLTQKLQDQGYTNITGIEADDGYWEGKGVKDGKIMEFKANPKTGVVMKEKIDD